MYRFVHLFVHVRHSRLSTPLRGCHPWIAAVVGRWFANIHGGIPYGIRHVLGSGTEETLIGSCLLRINGRRDYLALSSVGRRFPSPALRVENAYIIA